MARNYKKRNTFIAAVCIASILLSACSTATAVTASNYVSAGTNQSLSAAAGKLDKSKEIDGHYFLTSNSNYNLYLKEDDLSVIIEDKKTGKTITSYPTHDDGKNNALWQGAMHSAIVMTLINKNDDTKQADLLNDDVTKTVTYRENGFSAELYWNKYKLGMTLEVSFDDNGLVAFIPETSIREDSTDYYIGTLSMYQYMGTSYLDDNEGYMLIPDGNGALVYLDDKEGRFSSGYSVLAYSGDVGFVESDVKTLLLERYNTISSAEQVLAPIFGIAHTDDEIAMLGIVEDGAARADINVMPNGVSIDYNRAYARFILRKLYTQPTSNNSTSNSLHVCEADRSHSDLGVRFIFTSGEAASYSGMANAYRDYLAKNNMLPTLTDEEKAFNTRVDFMGTERQNWLLGTAPVVMTTTEDIKGIYSDLRANGVNDIVSVYKGWQASGIYDLPIKKYKADSNIGGTGDLTDLIKSSAADGIDIYLYNDALIINPEEQNATFNIVKKVNKRRYEYKTYGDVYDMLLYLTPDRSRFMLDSFISDAKADGVNNVALAGVSNTLFTYTYSSVKYSRFDTAASYKTTIDNIAAGGTNLMLEQPIVPYWSDAKAFLDMPLYTSSYILEDEEIPFLSLVLTGVMPVYADYVNFEANKQEFFLKMVESGCYPSFYITENDSSELIYTNSSDIYSSQYSSYSALIAEYNEKLGALRQQTGGATISDHSIIGNGITRVTYSNGVRVYVNYGSTAAESDGVTVEPMSYAVVTG